MIPLRLHDQSDGDRALCQGTDQSWDPIDIRGVSPSHVNRKDIPSPDAQGKLLLFPNPENP